MFHKFEGKKKKWWYSCQYLYGKYYSEIVKIFGEMKVVHIYACVDVVCSSGNIDFMLNIHGYVNVDWESLLVFCC